MFDPHLIYIAIPAFAVFDRLFGSDFKWHGRSGHSVATLGALLLAGLMYFVAGWPAAAGCVAWVAYRSLSFAGGGMAPKSSQIPQSLLRHLVAPLLIGGILAVQHQGLDWRMLVFVAYAGFATCLAAFNGATDGKHNAVVEAGRGLLYGVAFCVVFGI